MSSIRKQAIISSLLIYIGFAFGALNTYLFTKQGLFTPEQYGLTRAFIVIGSFFYGFAGFGLVSVIYKFYPYYKDNLPSEKNDLLTLALLIATVGFLITLTGGIVFKTLVVQKFIAKSPLILQYYYWVFPFTFFLLFFSLLESYAWSSGISVIPNFLRETGFRFSTTLLIVLFILTGKNFDLFIKIFSLSYALSFFVLLGYLIKVHQFRLVFEISRVTRKFKKKILILMAYVYGGTLISTTASGIDFLTIASYRGLNFGAVFDFSSYVANVIQVPQRSVLSVAIPMLSRAWKEKDFDTIDKIYKRSSLNLLLISVFLFGLIWINYDNAITALHLNGIYEEGKWVVFLLAMKNIVDMGTGVNGQIIGTSVYWRFDFFSGIILLVLIVPLNILLVKEYGIIGSAWSNLVAFIIYNAVRLVFLIKKFKLQPFSKYTVYVILHSAACLFIVYYLFRGMGGMIAMIIRSVIYVLLYGITAAYFNLSPDIKPVLETIGKRLRLRRG